MSLPVASQMDADRNLHNLASYPAPRYKRAKIVQEPPMPLERLGGFAAPRPRERMEQVEVSVVEKTPMKQARNTLGLRIS